MKRYKKLNEKELRKRINDTFKAFPINKLKESLQNNPKNYECPRPVVDAFRTLPENKNGSIITSRQFCEVLIKNKTYKAIENAIIKEHKITRRVVNDYGGWGGKRGIGREWLNYIKTIILLYSPRSFIKQCKSDIKDEIKFYDLIIDTHSKKLDWNNVDKAVKIALYAMYRTLNNFYKIYDKNNPNHIRVLSIIFGENYKLYYPDYSDLSNSFIQKGKKVTEKSIMNKVEKVLAYPASRYEGRITSTMKFYFLAYLSEKIYGLLDMHKEPRIEYSLRQIVSILKPLSAEERDTVLSRLFPPDSSSHNSCL